MGAGRGGQGGREGAGLATGARVVVAVEAARGAVRARDGARRARLPHSAAHTLRLGLAVVVVAPRRALAAGRLARGHVRAHAAGHARGFGLAVRVRGARQARGAARPARARVRAGGARGAGRGGAAVVVEAPLGARRARQAALGLREQNKNTKTSRGPPSSCGESCHVPQTARSAPWRRNRVTKRATLASRARAAETTRWVWCWCWCWTGREGAGGAGVAGRGGVLVVVVAPHDAGAALAHLVLVGEAPRLAARAALVLARGVGEPGGAAAAGRGAHGGDRAIGARHARCAGVAVAVHLTHGAAQAGPGRGVVPRRAARAGRGGVGVRVGEARAAGLRRHKGGQGLAWLGGQGRT